MTFNQRLESMIEQYCEMGRAIDRLLREHTGDRVGLCSPDHVQFWLDESNLYGNGECTIEDFKQLVNPNKVTFTGISKECGYHHYDVVIGTEVCTLVITCPGGASDDVSLNAEV